MDDRTEWFRWVILIERHDVDPDQAFDMLVKASQRANIKLHEVAQWLVTRRVRDAEKDGP